MKIEENHFGCVTQVDMVSINSMPNELAMASSVEIKPNIEAAKNENLNIVEGVGGMDKVPYILNGELYQILARNGENVTVKCCFCPIGRLYRGSVRSTGNFHMHIKRRHPYLLGRLHDMKVASLLERRDRLTQNRRSKLRRINQKNNAAPKFMLKGEIIQDLHKLKIKRAFQRHQAEAKENNQQSSLPTPVEAANEAQNDVIYVEPTTAQSLNVNVSQQQIISYPSSIDGSALGECSTPASATVHQFEIKAIDNQNPLDLSLNGSSLNDAASLSSGAALNAYSSSGIGLGPMYSDTTVANTVSTTISAIKSCASENHVTATMFHNCDNANWHRLSMALHNIHEDMCARNRIEHNRLLLDIAKFKFLNPGFYFNLHK